MIYSGEMEMVVGRSQRECTYCPGL